MTPREILIAAKAKIQDPERWCRWWYARDENDLRVHHDDKEAVKWCSIGSLDSITYQNTKAKGFLATAAKEIAPRAGHPIVRINDYRGHPTVMKMFDRAIELAKEAE